MAGGDRRLQAPITHAKLYRFPACTAQADSLPISFALSIFPLDGGKVVHYFLLYLKIGKTVRHHVV